MERSRLLTRRRVLVGGTLVAAGVAVGLSKPDRPGASTPKELWAGLPRNRRRALQRVTGRLTGTTLSADAVRRWMAELEQIHGKPLRPMGPTMARRFARQLLASTDFFQTGMDPDRPAQWVALYKGPKSACYNPFRG